LHQQLRDLLLNIGRQICPMRVALADEQTTGVDRISAGPTKSTSASGC
jgi:hypothetical protein